MPDLLVVVLHVHAAGVGAWLAEVDRPGTARRAVERRRGDDLVADVVGVLHELAADGLGPELLALAVAVDAGGTRPLLQALGDELPSGWGLPATLPVVVGRARAWAEAGARVRASPLVAGAAVAAARSVGAHAHLPPG